ncbi:MAG: hypothetical protein ABW220_08725, partial [Burkholderiaceae bacterium]
MVVWFDATFDQDGQVQSLTPVNESEQPEGFWSQMKSRLQKAKIPPVKDGDAPATFRTGMRLQLAVNKADNTVGIRHMALVPIPTTIYYASYPKDASANAGWSGELKATCRVGVDGLCSEIVVTAPAGMPESVRRFGKASMAGWRFQPQQVNGKPVEGEYVMLMHLNTTDDMPVDFRDPRKL